MTEIFILLNVFDIKKREGKLPAEAGSNRLTCFS